MKQVKRFLSIFLSVMLFLSVCPMEWLETIDMPGAEKFEFIGEVSAAEVIASGTCGDNITWTLTEDTEVEWDLAQGTPYKLTLTGSGEMNDYDSYSVAPWYDYRATITSISVGNGITSIGEDAFLSCASLVTLSLPDSLLSINSGAFQACYLLESIVIPNKVKSIGKAAFWKCSSLESVVMGANTEIIEQQAFEQCSSLVKVTLNNKLVTIADNAFAYTGLESIELPDSLLYIGKEAFERCRFISITIPKNVVSISEGAFALESFLSTIIVAEGNKCFSVIDSILYEMKEGKPHSALAYPSNLQVNEVTIADGTERIASYTFYNAQWLKSITFPETLKEIGDAAFENAVIKEIILPDSVESIGNDCFASNSSLTKVSLGAGLKTIGSGAFYRCTALNTITCSANNDYFQVVDNILYSKDNTVLYLYPAGRTDEKLFINETVTTMEKYSICWVNTLKELFIPASVKNLGNNAIYMNSNLSSIYFYGDAPGYYGSTCIRSNAKDLILFKTKDASGFSNLNWTDFVYADWDPINILIVEGTLGELSWTFEGSMGRITFTGSGNIPDYTEESKAPWSEYLSYIQTIEADGQLEIGNRAFYQAENLLRMQNEGKTICIGDYAFGDCTKLFSIETADANSIGISAFKNCASLTEINLSPQLTILADEVFAGCTGITNLMIPKNVTSIGNGALKKCTGIRTINIPAAVVEIGSDAFSGDAALEKVYFYGEVPLQWAEDSFTNCNSNLTLYYRNAQSEWATLNGTWNSIPVQGQDKFYTEYEDHYSFRHSASSFGYDKDYRIPRQRYVDVMKNIIDGTYYYAINKRWSGSCLGMASTTLEFYENPSFDVSSYDAEAQNLYEIAAPANPKSDLTKLIEAYQISQYYSAISGFGGEIYANMGKYQELVQRIEEFERSGGLAVDSQAAPIVIALYSLYDGHAVVPVSVEQNDAGDFEIEVYDCNYPDEFQNMIISKDYKLFSYGTYYSASYIDYTTIANLMSGVTLYSDVADSSLYLSINKEAGNVVNSEGKGIDEIEGAYEQKHLNGATEDTFSGIRSFVLPEGNYTISSGDASNETDSATDDNDTENAEGVTFYMASADTFAEISTNDEEAILQINQKDTENGELVLSLTNATEEDTEEEKTSITLVNASGMERTMEIDSTSATISIAEDEAITVEAPTEATVIVDGTPLVMTEGKAEVTFTASETENSLKVQDVIVDVSCGDANVLNGTVTASVISNSAETLDTTLAVTIEDVNGKDVAAYTTTQQINSGINDVSLELSEIVANFQSDSLTENLICRLTVTDNNRVENTAYAEKKFEVIKSALVAFDTNGGTGTYAPIYVTQNGTIPKPDTDPVRENYTFKFWSTDGVTEYNFAESVTTAKITLVAVWEANATEGGGNTGDGGIGEIPATAIKLNKKASLTLNKGKTVTLTATLTPSNSTDSITWSSSKKSVASITANGKKATVKALKKGTSTITAKTSSGKTVTCKITVKTIPATKVKLNKVKVTLNKGKTATLKATLTPSNSTDTIKWTTSNKKIAKVTANGNKATISGLKKGTVTITAKSESGKKTTCKVTVKEIKSTKVKLNKTKTSIKVGKSVTLKATMTPKNSTDTITWTSSNKKVAKVSNKGKVTALKKGTTTITAKTSSGKKATCKITVK